MTSHLAPVRQWLDENDITLARVARGIGVDRNSVEVWMSGKRVLLPLRAKQLKAMLSILGAPPEIQAAVRPGGPQCERVSPSVKWNIFPYSHHHKEGDDTYQAWGNTCTKGEA